MHFSLLFFFCLLPVKLIPQGPTLLCIIRKQELVITFFHVNCNKISNHSMLESSWRSKGRVRISGLLRFRLVDLLRVKGSLARQYCPLSV